MHPESIDKLRTLALDASRPYFLEHPRLSDRVYLCDGRKVERVDVPNSVRVFVESFSSLVALLERSTEPEVLVSPGGTYFRDDEGRVIEFEPRKASLWSWASDLRGASYAPSDLAHFLYRDLALGTSHLLYRVASDVDFRRTATGSARVTHKASSLGNSVEAEASSSVDIPERVTFEGVLYPGTLETIRFAVPVVVSVDTERGAFILHTDRDGKRRAELDAARELAGEISDACSNARVIVAELV